MLEIFIMSGFFAACLFLLRRQGLLHGSVRRVVVSLALLAAFFLRYMALPYETLDYQNFLTRWVDHFRVHGGFRALRDNVGNYNVPYLYFLAAFSYTDYSDLFLIKYLSIAFDVLLAWAVMKLLEHFRKGEGLRLAAFCGTLLLPTVILNGSLWGQCDSIYVSLALLSVYYALEDRGKPALALMALSFAFKLQAVFFMPVFFLFFISGRIRWRDIWVFPGTYLLSVLPAVLLGRPLLSTLTLYLDQADSVGSGLNYNSPSLFSFYWGKGGEVLLSEMGILLAFFFCLLLLGVMTIRRDWQDDRRLLLAFALCAVCIPLLLPHMHDRYFFGADILGFVLAFTGWELLPVPFLCSFASLLGYHAYLKMRYLYPMYYGTVALLLAVTLMVFSMNLDTKKH